MFLAAGKETLERVPTPHDDPSSDEEEELEDKEPFGSFKI